mgnify:CR=1 FL=1
MMWQINASLLDQQRTSQLGVGVLHFLPWKPIGGGVASRTADAPLPSGSGAALRTANFRPSEAPVPSGEAWGALRAKLFVQSR